MSREQREKVEADVDGAGHRALPRQAPADYAKQFGYGGYAIREVNVSSNEPAGFAPVPMLRAKAMARRRRRRAAGRAGQGRRSVTVSGDRCR